MWWELLAEQEIPTLSTHWIAAIASAAGSLITIVLSKGVPMLSAWMKLSTADRKVRAGIDAKGYSAVICRLDERIAVLEKELVRVRDESVKQDAQWEARFEAERQAHFQCRIEQTRMQAEIEALKRSWNLKPNGGNP